MATQISDIPNLEKQIADLKKQSGTYEDKLLASPTALGGGATPTSFDISTQESSDRIKNEIQRLTDEKLKAQWYTPKTQGSLNPSGETESKPGFIGKTLDYLARPLYGLVGATKHVIGQGTDSLQQDIADNMVRNKNTFGDVLKTSGVPWAVAAPLGFALDIAGDPLSWVTMGGGALVPRLGIGAIKGIKTGEGIAKGVGIAAKSNILETATSIGRITPFFKKTEAFAKLGEKSLKATDAYEALTGVTFDKIVMDRGIGVGSYKFGLKDVFNKVADAIPGGQKVLQNFVYDPSEWVRQARIKDIVQESLGTNVDLKNVVKASLKGESIEPFLMEGKASVIAKAEAAPISKGDIFNIDMDSVTPLSNTEIDKKIAALSHIGIDKKVIDLAPKMVNDVDDAYEIAKNPIPYISGDPVENALRLANETVKGDVITLEDLAKIVDSGALDASGVKWFDNMMKSTRDFKIKLKDDKVLEVGKNVMNTYDQGMSIFRAAKVGASPTSWTNAVVGNLIMTHMANGGIDQLYLKRLKESWNMYRNKKGGAAFLDGLLMEAGGKGDILRKSLKNSGTAARGTFGSLDFLESSKNAEILLQKGRDLGLVSATTKAEDIASDVAKTIDELSQVKMSAGTEPVRELLEKSAKSGEEVLRSEVGTGMLTNEMFNSPASRKMFAYIADKAKTDPSNVVWKILDVSLNKMPSGYEKIDQTFKMATYLSATVDGYTMNQLRQMRNLIDINPEEIVKYAKNGQYRYRLSSDTAIELANVMYLNYSAMPAAVRVMRNFPLIGSPFVSFMYGMTLKTGQTLAYNPAAFNKITFALNDFGGTKTPLEKKALNNEYYSYLKAPGMFRTPFFDKNPVYLNLASAIPYYSLNMFNPTKTQYGDSFREKLAQTIQDSPFMKDPAGSNMFDFMILPLILGEAARPQGQFGQPLYPIDATGLEKAAYGARSLGEAFVPNITSYAGLLTPEAAADFIPSYRWRQLARAKEGKNQLGISSKEAPVSRTVRTLLQATGVPVQSPINMTFNQGQ